MSDRDTQFREGFAELLWDDLHTLYLRETGEGTYEQLDKQIIAQRAYDFACHVAIHTLLHAHGDMRKIPDLKSWHILDH